MARYARKRDANERSIIEALQQAGCFVLQEDKIDLWVLPPRYLDLGGFIPLEVKMPNGKLTKYQVELHETLKEVYGYEVPLVVTPQDAYKALGLWL